MYVRDLLNNACAARNFDLNVMSVMYSEFECASVRVRASTAALLALVRGAERLGVLIRT